MHSSAFADEDPGLLTILHRSRQVSLPVIVGGEYRAGIAQSRHGSRYEAWLERFLADCAVLDISEETICHCVTVVLDLKRVGKSIPVNDLWIAALCRRYVLPVVTRDQHFIVIPNPQRLGWQLRTCGIPMYLLYFFYGFASVICSATHCHRPSRKIQVSINRS